jgi:hypothetical protein
LVIGSVQYAQTEFCSRALTDRNFESAPGNADFPDSTVLVLALLCSRVGIEPEQAHARIAECGKRVMERVLSRKVLSHGRPLMAADAGRLKRSLEMRGKVPFKKEWIDKKGFDRHDGLNPRAMQSATTGSCRVYEERT